MTVAVSISAVILAVASVMIFLTLTDIRDKLHKIYTVCDRAVELNKRTAEVSVNMLDIERKRYRKEQRTGEDI